MGNSDDREPASADELGPDEIEIQASDRPSPPARPDKPPPPRPPRRPDKPPPPPRAAPDSRPGAPIASPGEPSPEHPRLPGPVAVPKLVASDHDTQEDLPTAVLFRDPSPISSPQAPASKGVAPDTGDNDYQLPMRSGTPGAPWVRWVVFGFVIAALVSVGGFFLLKGSGGTKTRAKTSKTALPTADQTPPAPTLSPVEQALADDPDTTAPLRVVVRPGRCSAPDDPSYGSSRYQNCQQACEFAARREGPLTLEATQGSKDTITTMSECLKKNDKEFTVEAD